MLEVLKKNWIEYNGRKNWQNKYQDEYPPPLSVLINVNKSYLSPADEGQTIIVIVCKGGGETSNVIAKYQDSSISTGGAKLHYFCKLLKNMQILWNHLNAS